MALSQVSNHPKFADLKAILGRPKFAVLGCLEALWHFTAEYAPLGDVGRFTDAQIERWIDWDGEPGELIRALVAARFLDVDSQHRLLVHDWADYAPEYLKKRTKRQGLDFVRGKPQIVSAVVQTCPDIGGEIEKLAADGCPPNPTQPNPTQPNPIPPLPPIGQPTPVERVVHAITEAHPRGVSGVLLGQAISEQIRGPNESAQLKTLLSNTLAHCVEWRKDPKHAPELLRWMRTGGWLKPPPTPSPPVNGAGASLDDDAIAKAWAEAKPKRARA
jgi:hypothetical protein